MTLVELRNLRELESKALDALGDVIKAEIKLVHEKYAAHREELEAKLREVEEKIAQEESRLEDQAIVEARVRLEGHPLLGMKVEKVISDWGRTVRRLEGKVVIYDPKKKSRIQGRPPKPGDLVVRSVTKKGLGVDVWGMRVEYLDTRSGEIFKLLPMLFELTSGWKIAK